MQISEEITSAPHKRTFLRDLHYTDSYFAHKRVPGRLEKNLKGFVPLGHSFKVMTISLNFRPGARAALYFKSKV